MNHLLPSDIKSLKISQLRNLYQELRDEVLATPKKGNFTDAKHFDDFIQKRLIINSTAKSAMPKGFVLSAASQLILSMGQSNYSNGSGKCGGLNNYPVFSYHMGGRKLSEILKKYGINWECGA